MERLQQFDAAVSEMEDAMSKAEFELTLAVELLREQVDDKNYPGDNWDGRVRAFLARIDGKGVIP